ncbi:hypothetical protein Syun_025460 [Stephania yunnanensis]|uniref:Reverse transcriptase domain-containing protein n=1 Tax=Stephania yunnanensis TaxID=152371 RepID=A0AAP0HW80_9MAGN
MEFDGELIKFNIYDAMRHPYDASSMVLALDSVDSLVQDTFLVKGDDMKVVLENHLNTDYLRQQGFALDTEIEELIFELDSAPLHFPTLAYLDLPASNSTLLPSMERAPTLELKPLPNHLKYVFLGENDTLPVIISTKLTLPEEEKLIHVLQEFKEALGWTIADIKGISPSTCMHQIHMEEGSKPSREAQRRLNPPMMDVVKKEILKLLDAGMIYPISRQRSGSVPIRWFPRKRGSQVVTNSRGELVPTRVQNGWRVCIDYRKLNASTRKDHFPLPFIDQMLERLAARSHYCCLDGYSGFHQIPVAPEDQEKTTFTCPFGTFAYLRACLLGRAMHLLLFRGV